MLMLGKKPARHDAIKLHFRNYFNVSALPTPPAVFGKPWLVNTWGMCGNDTVGDCVLAGAAHETMLWEAEATAKIAPFGDAAVLSDYSAITGYDPSDPNTDQGTDVQTAAAYRQKTGVVDSNGVRHKVDVYAALRAGDMHELALATYLFGAVGVGVQLPQSAMDQFNAGEVWSGTGGQIDGGHYIPCVGRNPTGNWLFVTWGRLQAATPEWVANHMDEGAVYFSREELTKKGLSPEGYNAAKLEDDFRQVTA